MPHQRRLWLWAESCASLTAATCPMSTLHLSITTARSRDTWPANPISEKPPSPGTPPPTRSNLSRAFTSPSFISMRARLASPDPSFLHFQSRVVRTKLGIVGTHPGSFRKSGKQRSCGIRNLEVRTENGRQGSHRDAETRNGEEGRWLVSNTWLTIITTPPPVFCKCSFQRVLSSPE